MTRIWNKHRQTNTPLKRKVFVGLSGGVDSSVSAALLKEAGYDVTGVFIKVWQPDFMECTAKDDRLDAMRVCATLDIPFKTLDLEEAYRKEVVDYMIREYKAGRTPNPDIMCNKHIKFGLFHDWAINKEKADFVATGHYARARQVKSKKFKVKSGEDFSRSASTFALFAGSDPQKDQSYFLWTLACEKLSHVLFPIGHLKKTEVRKLAKKFGLITAEKKDSQGLCFIGKVDMKDFLLHYVESRPGVVLSEQGEPIGTHEGAIFFTIGQRHGFTITEKTPNDDPYYVVGKDVAKNTITVAHKKRDELPERQREFRLEQTNFLKLPVEGKTYRARLRYRQPLQACTVSPGKGDATVFFKEPQLAAAGQSAVIYDGERLIGGGIIA